MNTKDTATYGESTTRLCELPGINVYTNNAQPELILLVAAQQRKEVIALPTVETFAHPARCEKAPCITQLTGHAIVCRRYPTGMELSVLLSRSKRKTINYK